MFAIKTMPMHSCLALFFHLLHTMFVLILNTTSHAYGVKLKPEKKFRPERDSNPWPLRCPCSALQTELSRQQEAGHFVSS